MSVTINVAEERQVIRLEGDIDIGAAAELKVLLFEALRARQEIRISCEGVIALDVTAVQLLWSAERDARRAGLSFTLTSELSGAVRQSLEDIGLGDQLLHS